MKHLIFFTIIITLASCTASRFVEPLEKGTHTVGVNFGGPLIEFGGATIPVPFSALNYGYGVDSNLTVYGGLHLTAAYFGNIQVDLGATYLLLPQNKYVPAISISPALNIVTRYNFIDTKIWPAIDINGFWNYGAKKNYAYIGISNWIELSRLRAHNESALTRWVWSPQLGHNLKLKKGFQLQTEIKLLAPNHKNNEVFVPYRSLLGNRGASGVFINFIKTF